MKTWYSIFNITPYAGSEPPFYEKDDFNWIEIIEENWLSIKDEFDNHLLSNPRFNPVGKVQKVNDHGWWKTMPIMTWGVEFHKNMHNFPVTTDILKQIPGLVSASFNLLDKQSEINPHIGTSNAFVRAHLGLKIPNELPEVGINVKGVNRSWEEGKVLVFCDAYEHSTWNYSDKDRYILLIDVIRPEYMNKKKWICANILASLSLQSLLTKSVFWFYVKIIPASVFHFFLKISAVVLTPLYNFYGRNKYQKNLTQENM